MPSRIPTSVLRVVAIIIGVASGIAAALTGVPTPVLEENAYVRMKSFSCSPNPGRNTLQLDWRSDTAAARHPGWVDGVGDRIILQFKSLNAAIEVFAKSSQTKVETLAADSLSVSIGNFTVPMERLLLIVEENGRIETRGPRPSELLDISRDIERFLPLCLKERITEIEINK